MRTKHNSTNRASAILAVLLMLAIMFTLFTINGKVLKRLGQEVDALNKQQTNRLATITAK